MNQGERRSCDRNSSVFSRTCSRCLKAGSFLIYSRCHEGAQATANQADRPRRAESAFTQDANPRIITGGARAAPVMIIREEVESACKPGSVRLATRQSFLSARRRRLAPATYPGTTRAALSFPYLVLLRVGFTVPYDVSPVRGALLPHPFTLTTHIRGCRSAVCSLLHWPSAHAAQELPGTLPYGARTFLDALARDATVRPTPPASLVGAHPVRDASFVGAASAATLYRLREDHRG